MRSESLSVDPVLIHLNFLTTFIPWSIHAKESIQFHSPLCKYRIVKGNFIFFLFLKPDLSVAWLVVLSWDVNYVHSYNILVSSSLHLYCFSTSFPYHCWNSHIHSTFLAMSCNQLYVELSSPFPNLPEKTIECWRSIERSMIWSFQGWRFFLKCRFYQLLAIWHGG